MKNTRKLLAVLLALLTAAALSLSASAAEHRVVKGDTMWRISRSYGISLEKLIEANPQIKDPDLIYPNDLLHLPVTEAPAEPENGAAGSAITDVLRLTNRYRAEYGLSELSLDSGLCAVAQEKAEDMARLGYFSHTSPTYGTPAQMLKSAGVSYRYMGENIAKGYSSADGVMKGWMSSEGHKANILGKSFGALGVGYSANGNVWVQIFTD
ncbi:MAG: LysM peptidoglycan-binding domain-containing protein [Clostridia bacterium]|nr:LysM peptidoglycan-binding domain-containing protein [Clostridia bacterium]